MTTSEIKDFVSIQRPNAKFIKVVHSTEFIKEVQYPQDKHYFLVSLYDEEIESNFLSMGERILVNNTYAGSFIYNLGLCYYFFDKQESQNLLQELLNYNLKKFYAEQMYHFKNCIFSRAILLETLLYEQHKMNVVFNDLVYRKENSDVVKIFQGLGNSIFSIHEMGHLFFNNDDYYWNNEVSQEYRDIFNDLIKKRKELNDKDLKEIQCDFLGLISCLKEYKSTDVINVLIFSYYAMGILYSLRFSAKTTIEHVSKNYPEEHVNFKRLDTVGYNFECKIIPDINMIKRSMIMVEACEVISKIKNLKLYMDNSLFPISQNIFSQLTSAVDEMMNIEETYKRSISLLVAEAFHNHDEGMDFLYLQSKKFSSERELSL